jgi:hypothetical protein
VFCRLPNGDCVTQFTQKGAHGDGIVGGTRPDLDYVPPPMPRSSPIRSAAFNPEPVNTATVV